MPGRGGITLKLTHNDQEKKRAAVLNFNCESRHRFDPWLGFVDKAWGGGGQGGVKVGKWPSGRTKRHRQHYIKPLSLH